MVDHVESNLDKAFKLKECSDMLLAAGYFRARISGLSPFDVVVGGMTWAVTASNVDADIDIIFQENSTIGQKIRLADSLVKALVRMKCPHALQSHQIQGLDLEKIFPVIQWLVKQVLETRAITGDLVRQYSVSQFSKHYNRFPTEVRPEAAGLVIFNTVASYKPKRKFRKPAQNDMFASAESHVEATLLEYGQKVFSASLLAQSSDQTGECGPISQPKDGVLVKDNVKEGKVNSKLAANPAFGGSMKKKTAEEEAAEVAAKQILENKRLDSVADSMALIDGKVSGSSLGKIVSLGADEIKSASEAYIDSDSASSGNANINGAAIGSRGLELQHARQVENLLRQIGAATAKHNELNVLFESHQNSKKELSDSLLEVTERSERISAEMEKLESLESQQTSSNKELLLKLKQLVGLNESLKKQEQKFKSSCKDQLSQLQEAIKKLDADSPDDAETARLLEIEAIYTQDSEKHAKLRQVIAKKNQEITAVLRQIDDIPTRAELLQYERRFVELYTLVSEKLKETKKYYALYNTLADTRTYLGHEVSLLESISSGFPGAMKTQPGKDNFLEAFAKILEGVDKSIEKVKGDLESEKSLLELKSVAYNTLMEKQRNYFKTVKNFQEECFKNEKLVQMKEEQDSSN